MTEIRLLISSVAAFALDGNQPRQVPHDAAAVQQQKEQQEQRQDELDEGARHSHGKVATQGGGRLQRGVRGLRGPVLHLLGADRQALLHQAHQRPITG